jgi:hypothetical protein
LPGAVASAALRQAVFHLYSGTQMVSRMACTTSSCFLMAGLGGTTRVVASRRLVRVRRCRKPTGHGPGRYRPAIRDTWSPRPRRRGRLCASLICPSRASTASSVNCGYWSIIVKTWRLSVPASSPGCAGVSTSSNPVGQHQQSCSDTAHLTRFRHTCHVATAPPLSNDWGCDWLLFLHQRNVRPSPRYVGKVSTICAPRTRCRRSNRSHNSPALVWRK